MLAVRFVRLGEPCGASRPGWGGWSDGGVVPLRGCVSGDDGVDAVRSGRGREGWAESRPLSCDLGVLCVFFYRLEGVRVWRI